MKAQKIMEIRMKKKWRRDRRLEGNKLYLLLELFIGIRTEACSSFHSLFLGQVGRECCYEWSLLRNLFITLKISWELITLLQEGHKKQVSLCYNDSICGFPPIVFFLRGLSRLLVIITSKPLLWIMVITISFKDPIHNHCGRLISIVKTTALHMPENEQTQSYILESPTLKAFHLSTHKWLTIFNNFF